MSDRPLVSVIMTSFNAEKFIEAAIQSVLDQTYSNLELLIADDCSTDSTREIIAEFARKDDRIKLDHNSVNLHYLRTRNKLLPQTQGSYITFLDADDLMVPERIEKQLAAFDADPELALCGCHVKYIDAQGGALTMKDQKPLSYEEIKDSYLTKNGFTGSTIMLTRTLFEAQGWYRDFFNGLGCEDYDLTSRIVPHHKCINLPDELYVYRQFPESTSRANWLHNPFKIHSHTLVQMLSAQRALSGADSIDRQDWYAIINFINAQHRPFVDDPSYIFIRKIEGLLFSKLYGEALKTAQQAIKANPWKWYNYRTFWYCLKQRLRNT